MLERKRSTDGWTIYWMIVILALAVAIPTGLHLFTGPTTTVTLVDKQKTEVKNKSEDIFTQTVTYSYTYTGHVEYQGKISSVNLTPEQFTTVKEGDKISSEINQCDIDKDCNVYGPIFFIAAAILFIAVVLPVLFLVTAAGGF